ncbi:MAG: hypothetical protein IT258_21480, partial [Saprospiraceae bacterium]|nr:hypothetical protein [Saprospiraceae bacterium]
KNNTRWGIVALVVMVLAFSRLMPHTLAFSLFNFSPLGSIAIFSAAYFNRKYMAYLLPLAAIWITNLLLDNIFFSSYYKGFAWFANPEVYFAFMLIVLMGTGLLKKITAPRVGIAAVSASLIFFFVTNFYTWFNTDIYPRTSEGLIACFIAAIPFYWNTLYSDLFYSVVLFGGFELVKRYYPTLVLEKA